jgi:hypothetical protein
VTDVSFDRRELLGRAPWRRLDAYHRHVAALKQDMLGRRAELGRAYLAQNSERDPGELISPETGVGAQNLIGAPLMRAAIDEARAMIEARAGEPIRSKASLDYYATAPDFGAESAAVRLALSPEILCPIIRYFGMLPILAELDITRAAATAMLPTTTHMFHVDPDDITQIKAFVHLSDVDMGCGPLHALPADLTERVNLQLDYPRGRLTDDEVEALVGPGKAFISTGPTGRVAYVDTSRCLHFGGRPREVGRPLRDQLVMRFLLPTCAGYPQFEGDGKPQWVMKGLEPRRDDPTWNALIGAELT